MKKLTFTAAGDAMIFRHLPEHYEGIDALQEYILQGDCRFVNLETTVHNFESYASAVSGGSWFCSRPFVLEDIKRLGFNVLTTANNHALDYCHQGLVKTLEYIEASGLLNCGTGRNLAEASAPAYLDTANGRIALIGACSSFDKTAMAGTQSPVLPGRPGLNGVRFQTTYCLPKEQLEQIRQIAVTLGINAQKEIERKEGYYPPLPADETEMDSLRFREAETAGIHTSVNETDMKRIEQSIREAKFFADIVLVSFHSHECKNGLKHLPAEFAEEFCHRCIDAGAGAVIGTGPHLIRPLEIYHGCPIFYSLGDFIMQLETMERIPADMFEGQKLTGAEGMDQMFETRSDHGRKGLSYNHLMFEAIVPYWETEDGRLTKLQLMPVEMHFGEHRSTGGWPEIRTDMGIVERLAEMSVPYGTRIRIENGIGTVELG